MKARGDTQTPDLFTDYDPPPVDVRPRREVKAAGMEARVAKACAVVLEAYDGSREEAAAAMSQLLVAPVTKNTLDACCSEARETHDIQFTRAWALAKVSGDLSMFALAVEDLGFAIIPKRFLGAIRDAMYADKIEQMKAKQQAARREWRGVR